NWGIFKRHFWGELLRHQQWPARVSRRASLRSYRCALHSRSASASSKAFNVSSTVPRTTRSRWLLIRSSSIVMTLFSRFGVSSDMAAPSCWPGCVQPPPVQPDSGPPALLNCAKDSVPHLTVRHTTGQLGQAFETQQTEFSIDDFTRESVSAASCHLVSSGEEVAHALIDVSVNTAECGSVRPEAEVVRPAEQRPVQRIAHFEPWIVIAGHQQIANLR